MEGADGALNCVGVDFRGKVAAYGAQVGEVRRVAVARVFFLELLVDLSRVVEWAPFCQGFAGCA